ncbi:MAG: tetratricopeptide repeat protein, partial [Bacteroidota bacterium]
MISGIAGIYYYLENYEKAEQYNQVAITKALELLGSQSMSYCHALNTKGVLQITKGRYQEAIENFQASYNILVQHDVNQADKATSLANIADIYRRRGDYQESIDFLFQANEYYKHSEKHQIDVIANLLTIAQNYLTSKKYDQAISFSQRVIRLIESSEKHQLSPVSLAHAHLSIAESYRMQGEFKKCSVNLDQIKNIEGKINLDTQSEVQQEYGALFLAQKNYPKALEAFQQSLAINTQQYAKYQHHPKRAEDHQNIAECYLAEGKTTKAIAQYQKALQALALGFVDHDPQKNPAIENMLSLKVGFPILQGKARALFQQFQNQDKTIYLQYSLDTYQALGNLIDKARTGFTSEDSKLFLLANAQSVFEEGIQTALALYEQNQETRFLEKAFHFAESNKAILMQESL